MENLTEHSKRMFPYTPQRLPIMSTVVLFLNQRAA